MSDRTLAELNYKVGNRTVTMRVMDQVGPEDCFDVLFRTTLHRHATNGREDMYTPIPRSIKDYLIKTNLFI